MKKTCTLLFLLYGSLAFGQMDTAWVCYYNGPGNGFDFAEAIAVDENGNVFVTGYSRRSEGDFDFATLKYNQNGDLVWVRRYNGPANENEIAEVITIDDGGQAIWTAIIDSFPHAGGVTSVADMGDINSDGLSEVLAATDSRPGLAYCLDGADGQIIWSFQADDAFLSADRIGDVDDDGINDALFGAGDPYEDRAFCVSGATGQQIWYYSTQGGTVWFVHSISDLNGDGYQDALLGTWTLTSPVVAISGHSSGIGEVIWSTPINGLNIRVIPCPDLNGDGLEDVLVGSCNQYALALSGIDGSEIWRYYTRSLNGGYVWAIDWVPDITGDGIPEVAAGSFDYYLYLINGATGEQLWEFYTGNRIKTVRNIGDVNGDGFADVIAGTQYLSGTGGMVYLVSGGMVTTSIRGDPRGLPEKIQTLKNYPNPFNTSTTIYLGLQGSRPAKLSIYNLAGRLVREVTFSGKSNIISWVWYGRDNRDLEVSSGIYFSRLDSDKMTYFGKMILIK